MSAKSRQWLLDEPPRVEDSDEYAEARARYLDRVEDLPRRYGRTLAYSELGFSSSGIARKIDKTEGTVRKYLDRLEEWYGVEALYARPNDHAPEVLE